LGTKACGEGKGWKREKGLRGCIKKAGHNTLLIGGGGMGGPAKTLTYHGLNQKGERCPCGQGKKNKAAGLD